MVSLYCNTVVSDRNFLLPENLGKKRWDICAAKKSLNYFYVFKLLSIKIGGKISGKKLPLEHFDSLINNRE